MAYDHSRKIGNQGDVVKHSVLHNCVLKLLSRIAEDDPFVYAESHCGRATYILPEGSEWKHGIGLLSSKKKIDRQNCPEIDDYFESSLSSTMKVGQQYFGSSNIVFRCLRSHGRKFQFSLFEKDVHAFDDLRRFYSQWSTDVQIKNQDGYEGLEGLGTASLALIDPPSLLETEKIVSCIKDLINKEISYICWTPRNSSSNGNKYESLSHAEFGKRTDLGHHIAVKWDEPSGAAQHTFGCRLTVSADLKAISEQTTSQLVSLLGWTLG